MGQGGGLDEKVMDTAEVVQISSLALLKILKHARAGVPMEVMGLMLGDFVDDYTIQVVDVFSMPQSGTGVSVEAVDDVYQQAMMEMLQQTGRPENVVGWYHSHPGFGPWLSGVDIQTQQAFERLNSRSAAVVVDPIQSVKGKVVIDSFRLINPQDMMMGQEPRQTTSTKCYLNKPSIHALIHVLNRHYYSIGMSYKKNELEERMLLNLHKKLWTEGLSLENYVETSESNVESMKDMAKLTKQYCERVKDEEGKTTEEIVVAYAGAVDPKKRLEAKVADLMNVSINSVLGTMLSTVIF